MKIAILGATSYIARDLITSFAKNSDYELNLFARNHSVMKDWLVKYGIEKYLVNDYESFNTSIEFDVIINFVGIGDPAKAKNMDSAILDITYQYDDMVLRYLKSHPKCKYIFLSSGAVYNSDFSNPVDGNMESVIPINNLQSSDWYGIAKMYAECRHRSLKSLSIIDLRVFNYFSSTLDIDSGFFIAVVLKAIKNHEILITTPDKMVRDYIGPYDFYVLISLIISGPVKNEAIDCFTKSPVDKITLLEEMYDKFMLKYRVKPNINVVSATGEKENYYSINTKAFDYYGYIPSMSSLETVIAESAIKLEGYNE